MKNTISVLYLVTSKFFGKTFESIVGDQQTLQFGNLETSTFIGVNEQCFPCIY